MVDSPVKSQHETQASSSSSFIPNVITFVAGASYGMTTVIVGQPLDTIKTRMQGFTSGSQTLSNTNVRSQPKFASSALGILRDLYRTEGLRGLYRGGLPLLLGGSFMRSAQFGVSAEAKGFIQRHNLPNYKLLGTIDTTILMAGIAGGLGRAMVEIPTDFFKIRRQVQIDPQKKLTMSVVRKQILDGSLVTMGRNTILFASFIVYVDLSKQACGAGIVPAFLCTKDGESLTPFAKGAICANAAWLTCWPMDVIKTQRQSGNYDANASAIKLLTDNFASGRLFRGLFPGLLRSTVANGSSMVVYETVQLGISDYFGVQRKDMM